MKKYILSGLLAFILLLGVSSVASAEVIPTRASGGGGGGVISTRPTITFVKAEAVVTTPIEGLADEGIYKIYFDVYAPTSDVYIETEIPVKITSPGGQQVSKQSQSFRYLTGSSKDILSRSFIQKGTKRSYAIESRVTPQSTGAFQASLSRIAWATTSTSVNNPVVPLDPNLFRTNQLVLRAPGSGTTIASSTIKNVAIVDQPVSPTVNFYNDYKISWEGSNLKVVNIDLYDIKGLYKKKTIVSNYTAEISPITQKYTYDFDAGWSTLPEDLYVIRVTDALNPKVKAQSAKINFEWYRTPVAGNMVLLESATPVAKLTAAGSKETALTGEFAVKITATTDSLTFGSDWFGGVAERVSPNTNPNEISTKYESAKINRTSGDFLIGKDAKGYVTYTIQKGKTAVFVLSVTFKPEEMFAGQYVVKLSDLYANGSQGKNVRIKAPETIKTNKVTIIGEVAPYITSVTSPRPMNRVVTISGLRLNSKSNVITTTDGVTYTLPGAKDGKIDFVPSKVGMHEGYVYFQINSINGASNYAWLDVQSAANTANIFSAFWGILTGAF